MLANTWSRLMISGFMFLSSIGCISACSFITTLEMKLWMDGFHRNLTYEMDIIAQSNEIVNGWPYRDCVIGIQQQLPAGIYANPDELSDLRRSQRVNAISKKINIELPAEMSEPTTVYVIKKLTGPSLGTWLPLHARYHKAVRFGGYTMNEIEPPEVFIRCPDQRLEKCDEPLTPAKFLCSSKSKEKCGWKELNYITNVDKPIVWPVPVGDLLHYYPVAIGTTLVVTIGSVYLLLTINEFRDIYDY